MNSTDLILEARNLSVCYGKKSPTVEQVNLAVPKGSMVSLIGPNACGKSTIVKAVSRMIPCAGGEIILDGKPITDYRRKEQAQKMAVLLQNNTIPAAMTVRELMVYGRTPYVGMFERISPKDEEIVDWAMARSGITHLRDRFVGQLSGGERQRVLFSMAITRQPNLLILDEPTTYLDVSHQIELLELAKDLNRDMGVTIVMVLHELNQASFYSDSLYLMDQGRIFCHGTPAEVLTASHLQQVYGIDSQVSHEEWGEKPFIKILGLKENEA